MLILLGACAAGSPQYIHCRYLVGHQPILSGRGYAISMQPVVIPQEVARPQIVIRADASGEVIPLNAALWAGPLEAQIRTTLADTLSQRLNVVDVGRAGAPEKTPIWRIYVDVQRFDSLYGQAAQQEWFGAWSCRHAIKNQGTNLLSPVSYTGCYRHVGVDRRASDSACGACRSDCTDPAVQEQVGGREGG